MTMDPRSLRRIRLENEYEELKKLSGEVIHIEPLGPWPYARYKITFNIRTIVREDPIEYQLKTVCLLELPDGFPKQMPRLHILEGSGTKPPWHVNWYKGGAWCAGGWSWDEPLSSYIWRCAKTLQFDPSGVTNPDNAANREAIHFWETNKNDPWIFPTDRRHIPLPDDIPS